VSQISPPIRIVLAAAVIFLAAWMTVLKPKSAVEPAATPVATPAGNVNTGKPAQTSLGKAVEKAKGAAETANATSAAHENATGDGSTTAPSTSSGTSTAPAAKDAPAATAATGPLAGVPKPVGKAITKQKVLVLLFWNPKSADDRQVHKALEHVDRWNGRVYVRSAPITKIAKYGRIARGVDVEQSPTVVVVDRTLKATPLVGFVDTRTIDQAVVDALRASGGLFTSAYLRKLNASCSQNGRSIDAVPDANSLAGNRTYVNRVSKSWAAFIADVKALPAPARFRGLKRATLADANTVAAALATAKHTLNGHPTTAASVGALKTFLTREGAVAKGWNKRADKHHLISCNGVI
jgi:hypothetical protein